MAKSLKILGRTKGSRPKIESYEPEEELIKILEDCFGKVRKKDGQDCECDSLRIMVTSTSANNNQLFISFPNDVEIGRAHV